MRPKRTLFALVGALALAAGGCTGSSTEPAADVPVGKAPSVEFVGPERLTKPANLEARARPTAGSRVAAVTFFLDGRPLGSDTTRPYRLDVQPALLPQGEHQLRVEAVDNLGRRRSTTASKVTVEASGSDIVEASPGASFARARARLERGDVTVRLAPGRYRVDELELGSGARLVGSGARTVLVPRRSGTGRWSSPGAGTSASRTSPSTVAGLSRDKGTPVSASRSSTARATCGSSDCA